MADDLGRQSKQLDINLRSSTSAGRALTMTLGGTSSQLGRAAHAAALLAENIEMASKATKSLGGWIALVAQAAVLAVEVVGGWKQKTKEIAEEVRSIQKETAVFNAQAVGNRRLEGEAQIAARMQQQLDAARKMESIFRKFPELQQAIKAQADAARRALDADIQREFELRKFDDETETGLIYARMQGDRREGLARAEANRQRELDALQRNQEGLSPLQRLMRRNDIEDRFKAETAEVEFNIAKPAGQAIGRTFAGAIADGISTAVRTGSLTEGFKSLAGSLLIGLGQIMQMIGERIILASKLIAAAIKALTSLNPVASLAAGLALIIGGGVLQGLGQSMGGRGGGGYGGGASYGGYGSAATSAPSSYFGVVNPVAAGSSTLGLTPVQPVNINNPVFIGPRDPSLQREFLNIVKFATQRGNV